MAAAEKPAGIRHFFSSGGAGWADDRLATSAENRKISIQSQNLVYGADSDGDFELVYAGWGDDLNYF